MAKIRVYELARELRKDSKVLQETIRALGIPIKNYMSTLTPEDADRVRKRLGAGDGTASDGLEQRIASTVIRRRAAGVRRRRAEEAEGAEPAEVEAKPQGVAAAGTPQPPQPTPAAASPAAASPAAAPREAPTVPPAPPPLAKETPPTPPAEARPVPPQVAPTVAPQQPPVVEPPAVTTEVEAPSEPVPTEGEAGEGPVGPQVGTRIELPRGTRRLPGGLASRMTDVAGKDDEPEAEPAPAEEAPPVPALVPQAAQDVAPEVREEQQAPTEEPAEPDRKDRSVRDGRVVRDEEGVIVGAASQRSEPKILGFIPLEGRRQPQQVIITDASGDDRRGRASQRKQREERAQAQGRRRKMVRTARGREKAAPARRSTAEMSDAKKRIRVDEVIQVSDLAHQLSQKAANVLKVLWGMGMRGITINHAIDLETAELVAADFGYTVENVAFQEEAITGGAPLGEGERRAPVVAIMGHVDHGKTSLLDHIRQTNVAKGEVGGITQHIGAYTVNTLKGDVVFLDTPGHEAFTAMRARGAQVTDIVVLVVAADDGVMPTTVEAIKHCQEAEVPILVAINKIDKHDANPGRVKQSLMEHSLVGEEFGGETIICEVSAKTGQGIDNLLEMLALQAEILDLQAPSEGLAHGVVIEARVDKGRGPVATALVTSGTLHVGDIVVANESSGKIRRLFDQNGKKLKEVGPSVPAELLGLDSVPAAGDVLHAVESDRDAKQLVAHRREQRRRKESVRSGPSIQELMQRKKTPVLRIVLRADVTGSAEALKQALEAESTAKVKVEVIKADVGAINETDVKYAHASEAVVIGFNVKTAGKAAPVAESENVKILTFSVIYDALDAVKELMIGLLEPEYRERERGEAEVRALFPIPRLGVVAGCRIVKGSVQRSDLVRVLRDGSVVHKGPIASLRIFKDDVREVKEGFECGIVVEGFVDVQAGDMIQAYAIETTQPTL